MSVIIQRALCSPVMVSARLLQHTLFGLVIVAGAGLAIGFSAADAAERPNVIVVLADDQGWGDVSLNGNPNLSTPNIDSMAKEGAQLKNFYVCAVCSPTRAEFLTGRYHSRMGVYSTSAGGERFDAGERTIAEVFRDAGYATAAYGKWHSGMQWPYHPNARGFEDYYGFCSGHWGNYFDPLLEHNGKLVKGKGFIIDDLTDHAMQFAAEAKEQPFFIYLALNTPHSPMQVPQPYWDRFKDKELVQDPESANQKKENVPHSRAALAMCENIDDNMGRLLRHLKSIGKDRNTLVMYFSDNGPNGSRFNGGLRGRKGSTHEGGLRSVCAIRYPGQVPAGTTIKTVSGAVDLLPTLADLAGIDWAAKGPKDKPLDGISFAGELAGASPNEKAGDRVLLSSWRNKWSARTQRFRMHGSGELYDVRADRREKVDVSAEFPEVATSLGNQIKQLQADVEEAMTPEARPFPLGHPEAIWTQLPARDATFTGAITRSNRFPNCTYLLNWGDTESDIRWDVEVLSAGKYEVQMYYACPAADVGATVRLSIGDASIDAKVSDAVESPLVGAQEDRVKRQEGYVRWWKPMTLGTIELKPGRQSLSLKATEVPGSQAAEMRLLMFKKID